MRKHFPLVAFAAVAIASMAMATFAYVAAQDAARIKFEATADDALNRIVGRVDLHISLLRATHALFAAHSGEVSRQEFKAYFDALDVGKNFNGLRGLGLLGLAKRGEEASLERAIAKYHGISHTIFPPSNEEWRTPILLFEPMDATNPLGIGFDMFGDPPRREAIRSAMETGEPRASARVLLSQQAAGQSFPGFLVFSSLDPAQFTGGGSSGGKTGGLLYAAFRTHDLFKAALDKFPVLPVHTEVFDGAAEPVNLMFKSEAPPSEGFGEDFVATRQMMVAGQPWTIEFRPTAEFSHPSSRAIPVMLGLFGLLLAAAIALVARYQERAYDAMSRLQEAAERSLLEKDLMLQEMKHRIKNSITRVLAIARQTAGSAKDVGEFSASFAARLQAMAASQDMLTRSRWQKADLGELLRIELGQVFGKELPDGMLAGPKVLLSETMTQALGLTFHELATNALKYGEAGSSQDTLKVRWHLQARGRGERLALVWRETGAKEITPPAKPGFGTKLIDMNITRELNGTIARHYRADGLEIEIEIPLNLEGR